MSGDGWKLIHDDCVNAVRSMADHSVGMSVFSPPFASLYTYSDNERDMGNSGSDSEFIRHFSFLIAELRRVMIPGRVVAVHCMDMPTLKSKHGRIGVFDFPGALIRAMERRGFVFDGRITIWKNPVTAMQRTKSIRLLHKQIKKDSAMSGNGLPDYLLKFKAPGENPDPVEHSKEDLPVGTWQKYASPVWMDIDMGKTLQYRSAREEEDERHICPLQLEVIERAIHLWSKKGDVVLSPFAGIGSEGYEAIRLGRKFVGVELKESYFRLAAKNLQAAEDEAKSEDLFAMADA